jgi:hypothetical protein
VPVRYVKCMYNHGLRFLVRFSYFEVLVSNSCKNIKQIEVRLVQPCLYSSQTDMDTMGMAFLLSYSLYRNNEELCLPNVLLQCRRGAAPIQESELESIFEELWPN